MDAEQLAAQVRLRMQAFADIAFREGVRGFFLDEIEPWGVRAADLRKIVSYTAKASGDWPFTQRAEFSDELWRSGKFEEGVLVCHLWRRYPKPFGSREWDLFAAWIDRYVSNWVHCDDLSSWLISACLKAEPALQSQLPGWARATNRWKRRASAVALLPEAKAGRSMKLIREIALLLEFDKDEKVRRGLGWLLKEAYPMRPDETFALVQSLGSSRSVIRYASKKMSPAHRSALGLR